MAGYVGSVGIAGVAPCRWPSLHGEGKVGESHHTFGLCGRECEGVRDSMTGEFSKCNLKRIGRGQHYVGSVLTNLMSQPALLTQGTNILDGRNGRATCPSWSGG